MPTLHVTNGDAAAGGLLRSGLSGEVLPWRDVLHDGPVPPDVDRGTFRATRAEFLVQRHWASIDEVVADFASRDDQLDATTALDHLVLWFEPDLYDQLQLIQVLARLQQHAGRPLVSIVPADLMLGPLEPDAFPALHNARRPIGEDDLMRGRMAWDAFTSSTPDALESLVGALNSEIVSRSYASNREVRLPHLTAALHRLLEEYPDASTGISRSERQIIQALDEGASTIGQLYQMAHAPREAWTWLGDWSFAWYVHRLSATATPLISQADGSVVRAMVPGDHDESFWKQQLALTEFGSDVLNARVDAIATNGIDRWIGGVHLSTQRHWRWDRQAQRLESAGRDR